MSDKKPTYQELEKQITELKAQNSLSLKASEKKYQGIFNSMTDLFHIIELIYDSDGKPINYCFREVNPTLEELVRENFGKELVPNTVIDVFGSIEDYWLEKYHGVLKTGKTVTIEHFLGAVEQYFKAIAWKVSENQVAVIFTNTTQENQREKEQLATDLAFNAIKMELEEAQKIAKVGSWLFDPTKQKAVWSEENFHIWGFDVNNGPPDYDSIIERIHPDDLAFYKSTSYKAFYSAVPYNIELRINPVNGQQKTIRAICKPITSESGDVIQLKGVTQDITRQKKNEKEKLVAKLGLQQVRNDLDEAQKLAKIGSWLFRPETEKTEWSDEMFRIWGFDPSNGAPDFQSVIEQIHPDDLEVYENAFEAAVLGNKTDNEFRIYHSNGQQKTIRVISEPVFGANDEVTTLKGITQDISVQKEFETNQVKHQRLKAIGEMSSSIAHDFNNSLQEMMGNLDVITLENDFSGSTLERVNNIGSIIADAASRVSALQQFGDAEHDDMQTELINLNTVIDECVQQARPLWKDSLEKKGLQISIETDFAEIPEINVNRGELKSALYNLIKNSVEAMPKGGSIVIKTGIKAETVYTSFTDTGDGMSAETKLKVFEPFYSTKGLGLGRGLGMSGVYSIVKKYGGDVMVKFSELDKGTCIEMTLPIQQGPQSTSESISLDEAKDIGALAVLWVDDEDGIREGVSQLLGLMGHKCETVSSAKNALHALSNNTFDVVFTDIGMPEMNGWALADAIRSKFADTIKIVVVSGWDVEEKVKNEHGVNSTLRKPFNLEQLKEILLTI